MIPVKALYDNCEMMLHDKWGYIYGTAGRLWTKELQEGIQKRYSEDDPTYGQAVKYGSKWIEHMVTDCSGVMVYIWGLHGLDIPHGSSSMVREGYIRDCGSTPHPGWAALVDPTPDTYDNNHIGIVAEDGVTVYEARGTQYGFTTSKVTDKKWTKFGRFKDVDYSGGEEMDTPYTAEVVTNKDPLTMRSGPSTDDGKVGKVPKGAKVKVIMHGSEWDFISYELIQGYAATRYLMPIKPVDPPEPTPDVKTYDVVIPCTNYEIASQVVEALHQAKIV